MELSKCRFLRLLSEQHLYRSSRLGILQANINMQRPAESGQAITLLAQTSKQATFSRGNKFFELSNHLGNVLVTLSDKKKGVENGSTGSVLYYLPVVKSAQDYYPFGMLMPGRRYTAGTQYRYGFNGKEEDDEVKGDGNQQDYGMRIYDTRLGRFLSVDPLTKEYPWNSTYAYAENSPILFKDLDGLERIHYQKTIVNGKPVFTLMGQEDFVVSSFKPSLIGYRGKIILKLWEETKNPRVEHVVHQEREGTVEKFDKVQFVTYDETWTYASYQDMVQNKNGDYGGEKHMFYLNKGLQAVKEENMAVGGGGGGINWPRTFDRFNNVVTSEARSLLQTALKRQGLKNIPKSFKEKWSGKGFDYEVRIHQADANAPSGSNSASGATFRVARRRQGTDQNGQGYGWEYADDKGNWYKQSDLKANKNPTTANDTHIKL